MAVLSARFTSSAALLAAWDASRPEGGLFIPTTRPLEPGAPVVVELRGRALRERLCLRASVVSVQPCIPRERQRAGVVVAFAAEARPTVDYVLAVARGELAPQRRREATRLPVSLATSYRRLAHAESHAAEVLDLSTGGLSLRVAPLPLSSRLVVQLPVLGTLAPVELEGEVVFVAPEGDRVGVRFDWRGVSGVRRVREALRRLQAA